MPDVEKLTIYGAKLPRNYVAEEVSNFILNDASARKGSHREIEIEPVYDATEGKKRKIGDQISVTYQKS